MKFKTTEFSLFFFLIILHPADNNLFSCTQYPKVGFFTHNDAWVVASHGNIFCSRCRCQPYGQDESRHHQQGDCEPKRGLLPFCKLPCRKWGEKEILIANMTEQIMDHLLTSSAVLPLRKTSGRQQTDRRNVWS